MKHICCYSGGHSSALVAIEVVRRFGPENVVLVNHDIAFWVEHADIKRFKTEVADYLGVPITFVNYRNAQLDQFDVCVSAKAFKVGRGSELCTSRLKTEPFMTWLNQYAPDKDCTIYYGFDVEETARIQRRSSILGSLGFKTDFPLAVWGKDSRTIKTTEEINISRPLTYDVFKHGNCVGCLKAGWQHWYVVFCTRPDIWLKAKWAEDEIGYAIHNSEDGPVYLEEMEVKFEQMRLAGVVATEQIPYQTFWARARKIVKIAEIKASLPCDCANV